MLNRGRKFIKQSRWILLFVFSLLFALMLELGIPALPRFAVAQATPAAQQMQQGANAYQTGNFAAAIEAWQRALTLYQVENDAEQVALTLENLARAYQSAGQTSPELQTWQAAAAAYQETGNLTRVGRMLIEQAQTYSRLGQYGKAVQLLCNQASQPTCAPGSALDIARSQADLVGELTALGSLGDAYRLLGQFNQAVDSLQAGLALADRLPVDAGQSEKYLVALHNSLGNAYLSLAQAAYRRAALAQQIEESQDVKTFQVEAAEFDRQALEQFKTSLTLAQVQADLVGERRAMLSSLPIYRRVEPAAFETAFQQAVSLLETLPDEPETVYATVSLARLLQQPAGVVSTGSRDCRSQVRDPRAEPLLNKAVTVAQRIQNSRAQSFALGELGYWYECQPNYVKALELTQQAQIAADQQLDRDSLYLWQWQTGRILQQTQQPTEAIQAYEASLATLNAIRQDILTTSRDVQFDFRESVEPVYRQLVALRLRQEQPSVVTQVEIPTQGNATDNLSAALRTLDNLKLAELQNYFGNDCVLTELNPIDQSLARNSPKTAIFSTAVLGDRVAVIVNIFTEQAGRNKTIQQFEWIKDTNGNFVDQATLTSTINEYREGLELVRNALPGVPLGGYDPALAAKIYDWLIRPFQNLLDQQDIQTLVFVQDGIFRSVPMTALYDGSGFLIERYAVAITPSINLVNFSPVDRRRLRAIAVGLTQETTVQNTSFGALNYVNSELAAVLAALPRSSKLEDTDFTLSRFEQALETDSYPIVHIATHGKFSTEAENAFLVTGDNLTQTQPKLTINVLDDLIRNVSARSPVELLVLSACQTATGDDRAALGLAGIAAQAGARRVLASLWSVNDRATAELIQQFYEGLDNPQLTKAQLLQAAQKSLINSEERTAHPAFWSAFVLIGNWL